MTTLIKGSLDCVTFTLDGQHCALPIIHVRDVLNRFAIVPVPLAPHAVAGHLNLRGRIVTAIDVGRRIAASCIGPRPTHDGIGARQTAIVLEHGATLYALLVDDVRDVVAIATDTLDTTVPGLPAAWAAFGLGVVRRADGLLIVLDPDRLLAVEQVAA